MKLLATLFVSVGLPFFAVSTTSPLLQRWYAGTRSRGAADPYFLSVASNLGCLAALLAYPILIEPTLKLSEQSDWWRWGYLLYAGLVAMCAGLVWRSGRGVLPTTSAVGGGDLGKESSDSLPPAPVPARPIRRWSRT